MILSHVLLLIHTPGSKQGDSGETRYWNLQDLSSPNKRDETTDEKVNPPEGLTTESGQIWTVEVSTLRTSLLSIDPLKLVGSPLSTHSVHPRNWYGGKKGKEKRLSGSLPISTSRVLLFPCFLRYYLHGFLGPFLSLRASSVGSSFVSYHDRR